jgi:hypothetical protein
MPFHQTVEDAISEGEKMVKGLKLRAWATANLAKLATFPTKAATGPKANKVNAVLLGYVAWGRRTVSNTLVTFTNLIKSWSDIELAKELKAYAALSPMPKSGVILMPSFRYANQLEVTNAKSTLASAKQVMMKAYLTATSGARNAGSERTLLENWFGAYDSNRYATVLANLKTLNDVLGARPICVYYRGSRVTGKQPSDKPNDNGSMNKSTAFASAFKRTDLPAVYDSTYAHVTLAEKFFNYKTKNAGVSGKLQARVAMFGGAKANLSRPGKTYASTSGKDSIAGALVHELSHNLCDTDDITLPVGSPSPGNDCYGHTNCTWLKNNRPADAINNADNYEYYFEQFQ